MPKLRLYLILCFLTFELEFAFCQTYDCPCGYGGLCLGWNEVENAPIAPCTICDEISRGFYAKDCQSIVQHCNSNPCVRGQCVNTFGSYFCRCPPEYFGQRCEFIRELYTWERIDIEVYVYYQVQSGPKGDRTDFYLVFDPGEQQGIMRPRETGVKVSIAITDGRELFPMRDTQFQMMDVRTICEENAKNNADWEDKNVCRYLPIGQHYTYHFEVKLYQVPEKRGIESVYLPTSEGNATRVGITGEVNVKIIWMSNGKEDIILFNQSYRTFTYLKYRVLHECFPKISFRECSINKMYPRQHLRKSSVQVSEINYHEKTVCQGLRVVGNIWKVQRSSGFRGAYDPEPKEVKVTSSGILITYPEAFFTDGIHMIEHHRQYRGDPPYHGGQSLSIIVSRCWIQVELGPLRVQIDGGNIRTVPCYQSLELRLISLNPSYQLSDMDFIISCDRADDSECAKRKTEVPAIRKISTPCETTYYYTIEVVHEISIVTRQNVSVELIFVQSANQLLIQCVFNCYPVDPTLRMVLVAETQPYRSDTITWTVKVNDQVITDREPDVEAFHPVASSRILRIDGSALETENQTTNVVVEARATFAPLRTVLEVETSNLRAIANQFELELVPSENEEETQTYRFVISEVPIFTNAPMSFKVIETSYKLRDSLILVETNHVQELVFQPEWERIQLCVMDCYSIEACSEEHEVKEKTNWPPTKLRDIEALYEASDIDAFLHSIAIWLYTGLFKRETHLQWNVKILVRHILLQYALSLTHPVQSSIQATTLILSVMFYSEIGNEYENLTKYEDDDHIVSSFNGLVDWINLRFKALVLLSRMAEWTNEFCKGPTDCKLHDLLYGDIMDGLIRTWTLAHFQGLYVSKGTELYSLKPLHEKKEGYLVRLTKDDARVMFHILNEFVRIYTKISRLFYGIRHLGTSRVRAWTMRTTYQGVKASFNKSRTGESLAGYSSYVFGPDVPGLEWVALADVILPEVEEERALLGRELCFSVFLIGSRKGDIQVSPTLYIDLRSSEKKVYQALPDKKEFQVVLPVLIEGEFGASREIFFYTGTLYPLSETTKKLSNFSVFKYYLPNVFERWGLTFHFSHPVIVKVKVSFHSIPEVDEVDKEASLELQGDPSSSDFTTELTVMPENGETELPLSFYVGIIYLSSNTSNPVNFKLTRSVNVCEVRDPLLRGHKKTCKGVLDEKGEHIITCFCDVLGFITAIPKEARITQILVREAVFVIPIKFNKWAIGLPFLIILFILCLLGFAYYNDHQRNRREVLIHTKDTFPGDRHLIVVGVFTGKNILAGTISTVAIKIIGLNSSSRVHTLKSKHRKTLKVASDNWFLLATQEPLGKIKTILLWHNYRCLSNWYCDHILIYEVNHGTWFYANVQRWFRLGPIIEECRLIAVPTVKFSSLENGLQSLPHSFLNHYIIETRNTHPVFSLFCLHERNLFSNEQRNTIFIIKCLAMSFWIWIIIDYLNAWVHESYKEMDDIRDHIEVNPLAFFICVMMAICSYAFTAVYIFAIKSSHTSRLIQRKTTNPTNLEIQEPAGHLKSPTKEKAPTGSDSKHKSVMFQLDSKDHHSGFPIVFAKPGELSQSLGSRVPKKKWAVPQSRWKRFVRMIFGPSQFRCVNISHHTFSLKLRYNTMALRFIAAFMILICLTMMWKVETEVKLWSASGVAYGLLIGALVFDAAVICPLLTLFNGILSFAYMRISNREIYLWHEETKVHPSKAVTLKEYIRIATGKNYKPMLSSEIERLERASMCYTIFHSLILNLFLVLMGLLSVAMIRNRMGSNAFVMTNTLVAAYDEADSSLLDELYETSPNSIPTIHNDLDVEAYIALNIGDLPSRWRNTKFISRDEGRWGKDYVSKIIGASSLIVTFSSTKGSKKKVARIFDSIFSYAEGDLSETGINEDPISVNEELLNYTEVDTSFNIEGRSGITYHLVGHQAVIPARVWKTFYFTLTGYIQELFRPKNELPTVRVLILTTNFLNVFTRRVVTIDFVAEFLPSGISTARLLVSPTLAYSDNYNVVFAIRFFFIAITFVLFMINVSDITKVGFKKHLQSFHGLMKAIIFLSGLGVVVSTFVYFFPKHHIVDQLFEASVADYVDVHRLHSWDRADSIVLVTVVFFICVNLSVELRNAFGMTFRSNAAAQSTRKVLAVFLIAVIICRAMEFCFGFYRPEKLALVVDFHSKVSRPLGLYSFQRQFVYCTSAVIFIIFSKMYTAVFIYYLNATQQTVDPRYERFIHSLKFFFGKKTEKQHKKRTLSNDDHRRSRIADNASVSSPESKYEARVNKFWAKVKAFT